VTKSQYPYPPDEFDVRGPEGAPVGVHREPRSGWSSAWPFLLVAVVFAGLGVGIVAYLSDGGDTPEANPPAASEQSAAPEDSGSDGSDHEGDGASEEPTDGEGAEDGAEDGSEGEEPEEPSDEESEEPTAEMPGDPAVANLGSTVVVWNDGAGAGEAGAGSEALAGAGFTEVGADDAPNAPVLIEGVYDETTVLYGADRADTATAVAEALGVDAANVQESDDVTNHPTDAVWVVLKEPVG
jgi:hypothetical protein